ncbi:MAG: hypothetical protein H7222_06790 [Methylotenera sp.]|nr:hypothetical protein [Oligoflexia bacterium]
MNPAVLETRRRRILVFFIAACFPLTVWSGGIKAAARPSIPSLMKKVGFDCGTAPLAQVHRCLGRISGYPGTVAILIPAELTASAPIQWVVHLHGFEPENDFIGQILNLFEFEKSLRSFAASTSRQAVWIVPSSEHPCRTFEDQFSSHGDFEAFFYNVMELLTRAGVTPANPLEYGEPDLTLSAHSGAYRAVSNLLRSYCPSGGSGCDYGIVSRLALFDAVYCKPETVDKTSDESWRALSWFSRTPGLGFRSLYVAHDDESGTVMGNQALMRAFRPKLDYSFHSAQSPSDLPRGSELGTKAFVSVEGGDHYQVVHDYFASLLGR